MLDLSEQQLVDCVYPRTGCDGGWMTKAYRYISDNNGIHLEKNYGYTARYSGSCQAKNAAKIKIHDYIESPNEDCNALKLLV